MTTLGFVGTGNMGSALIQGWAANKDLQILGLDVDQNRLFDLQAKVNSFQPVDNIQEMIQASQFIFLAVKPYQIEEVLKDISPYLEDHHCLISIAAGIKQDRLINGIDHKCPVVRTMPNTPALVGSGVFALCFDDPKLRPDQGSFLKEMFSQLGTVYVLEEKYFNAYTALIGSGPAYVFYFLESLIEAGVSLGLNREQTTNMVTSLVQGSVKMALENNQSISNLREMVTSPGGTTIAGLNHLDRQAVRSALIDAVEKARNRADELG